MTPAVIKAVKERFSAPSTPAAIQERIAELEAERDGLVPELEQVRIQLGELLVDRGLSDAPTQSRGPARAPGSRADGRAQALREAFSAEVSRWGLMPAARRPERAG
jgi:hypothetical protein